MSKEGRKLRDFNVDYVSTNTLCSRNESQSYCFWRQWSCDQDDNKREEARQWDMFPEPTELLLTGCLTESIWTPKIQIKCVDTKNQIADIFSDQRKFPKRWMESSFFVQYYEFLDVVLLQFLATFFPTILIRLEGKRPCRGERRAKAKPCLFLREREQRSEEISLHSLESRVNPENAMKDKSWEQPG